MKGRWLWIVIGANLVVLVALAFVYPHLMVSPGPLIAGHLASSTDCFACHAPLRGAVAERCIACHTLADIGLRTTRGVPIVASAPGRATPLKGSFHQELAAQDCVACHSDHAGPRLTRHSRKPFSHGLLRAAARERCDSCHGVPADAKHRHLEVGCATCHTTVGWKPASFDHAALPPAERSRCEACHQGPSDTLHAQISGSCAPCHATTAWKPATFEHDQYFALDKDHDTTCVTCHTAADYRQYTCYGCHEHTPANVRSKHVEEGISNFEDCVSCHRSADGEREGGGKRQRDKRD